MSHSAKPIQEISSFDSLTTWFHDSLSCNENKPDFCELDLVSPVSIGFDSTTGRSRGFALFVYKTTRKAKGYGFVLFTT
ncbi:hypothetical protein CFP56_010614 [Quercus suber]|uniref:Uncharacterized protein n=1 Tax=Quercus suber TaxID=58331 RepID=A0AAW0L0R6_QUESU